MTIILADTESIKPKSNQSYTTFSEEKHVTIGVAKAEIPFL